MATTVHRSSSTRLSSPASLDRMLRQQGTVLRNRRQTLLENEPTELSGVTDDEERSLDSEAKGVGFSVLALTSRTVQKLEVALRRKAAGELGVCGDCHATISAARMKALPFADLCLACQELRDADEGAAVRQTSPSWQERSDWGQTKALTE